MEFLIDYWFLVIVLIAAFMVGGYLCLAFINAPTAEQIKKVKEWMLMAVAEAEKEFGSGTGQIKLRYVYDLFIARFPHLAKIIPFYLFSNLIDEVLVDFRKMLETNDNLKNYIEQ